MKNRMREIRKSKGMTLQQVADASGTIASQIQKLELGERKLDVEWMPRIARALNVEPQDLIAESRVKNITISHYINEKGELWPYKEIEQTPCPVHFNANDIMAAIIKGDGLLPVFHNGWIVFYSKGNSYAIKPEINRKHIVYNKESAEPYSECLGKPCIIDLVNGRSMLRILKKGSESGKYNLVLAGVRDIDNAEIKGAYKIIFIEMR